MTTSEFRPDFTHFSELMQNRRPARLPIYEHNISTGVMEKILDCRFAELIRGSEADITEYFKHYSGFFKEMSYDVVSYEVCITEVLPGHGALSGGKAGPIQNRKDFEAYPWDEIPSLYWQRAQKRFDALAATLPGGMKAVGGIGNGPFELSEDLVGLEYLPFIQIDDPELYADIYNRIGDMLCSIWQEFLKRYSETYIACRFGDDLGFKSSLLTNPATLKENVFPQYRRVIDLVHSAGRPFLLHSCGCIFEVMDAIIGLGIDAKHSNEDGIAPFDRWIDDYSDKIALLGGFDMDFLCSQGPDAVYDAVLDQGTKFRANANGYALGSGNSIPDYVPVENYLAMLKAAQTIRESERQ